MSRANRHARRRPRRLFWRIYLYGLLLIACVLIAGGVAAHVAGDQPPWAGLHERVGPFLLSATTLVGEGRTGSGADGEAVSSEGPDADTTSRAPEDPSASALPADLAERVAALQRLVGADMALFGHDGELLASAGTSPIATLPEDQLGDLGEGAQSWRDEGTAFMAIPISRPAGDLVLVVSHDARGGLRRLVAALFTVLIISAIVLFPLARSISRPLEAITRAAARLGEGDLDARTGVDRRDEVGRLARSFDVMANRITLLLQSEREMLANVSHELRTPLARLRVALEICEEAEDVDELRGYLEGIGDDVGELHQLVEDVLVAARLDLERVHDQALVRGGARFDLAEVALEARDRVSSQGDAIAVRAPSTLACFGDEKLVRRLLENLLGNALKHGRRDGSPANVELELEATDGGVRVSVADRGPGVEDDALERLFEPFYQVRPSRDGRGVGLGLTLCRRIVEAHGGRIGAENRLDGGLRVWFTLPTT